MFGQWAIVYVLCSLVELYVCTTHLIHVCSYPFANSAHYFYYHKSSIEPKCYESTISRKTLKMGIACNITPTSSQSQTTVGV